MNAQTYFTADLIAALLDSAVIASWIDRVYYQNITQIIRLFDEDGNLSETHAPISGLESDRYQAVYAEIHSPRWVASGYAPEYGTCFTRVQDTPDRCWDLPDDDLPVDEDYPEIIDASDIDNRKLEPSFPYQGEEYVVIGDRIERVYHDARNAILRLVNDAGNVTDTLTAFGTTPSDFYDDVYEEITHSGKWECKGREASWGTYYERIVETWEDGDPAAWGCAGFGYDAPVEVLRGIDQMTPQEINAVMDEQASTVADEVMSIHLHMQHKTLRLVNEVGDILETLPLLPTPDARYLLVDSVRITWELTGADENGWAIFRRRPFNGRVICR